jgi:hypothetical protein
MVDLIVAYSINTKTIKNIFHNLAPKIFLRQALAAYEDLTNFLT